MTTADQTPARTRAANRSKWARLSYRIALLIAILLVGSAIATTVFSVRSVQRTYSKQSTESVTNVHKSVTDTISVANKNVIAYEDAAIETRKNQLKDQSNGVVTALDALNAAVTAGQISKADAQANALVYLKAIRFGDGYYFFTYNRSLVAIEHPNPQFQGKNLSKLKDADGSYILQGMQKLTDAKGSGYYNYNFAKLGSPKPVPKISYVFNYKPWDWLIGTGVYIDDIQAEADARRAAVRKTLSDQFGSVTFNGGGLFFVLDKKGNVVVAPKGKNLTDLAKTPAGKEAVKVIEAAVPKNDGNIVELNKSVTLQGKNKQNWVLNVSSYNPLNWVLVSAVPQQDLTAPGRRLAVQQALLQVLLLIIGLTAGILISRRITGPVESVTKAARDLSENNFDPSDLDAAASRTDEVGDLARAFQRMGVDLVERERKLREQVASLKVVIDRNKLAKDIGEITESEFFQDLAAKADEMRKKKFD